jgi:hypothetical protein
MAHPPRRPHLYIHDAQDVEWVRFEFEGAGDPVEWFANVVQRTCTALNVETGFHMNTGDELTIEEIIVLYCKSLAEEGFRT